MADNPQTARSREDVISLLRRADIYNFAEGYPSDARVINVFLLRDAIALLEKPQ